MAGATGDAPARGPGRGHAVLTVAGAIGMVLSACSAGSSSSPSRGYGAQCSGPAPLHVQVTADPDRDQLTLTTAGIGGSTLSTAPPVEAQEAPGGDVPVRELPPGTHVRMADLDDGEIVRAVVLTGGIARTEALAEGEYLVGLISVDDSGRIAGLASSRVVVDERGGVVSNPSLEQSREVPVEGVEVQRDNAVAEVSAQEGAPARTQWWLQGQQDSGQFDAEGTARVSAVADGTHTLLLLEESAEAPGIAQRAASCRFGVSHGELTLPEPDDTSS